MAEGTYRTDLIELTGELVVAWLSNPQTRIPAGEVPVLVTTIYSALTRLAAPDAAQPELEEYTPAVSVRSSLASKNHIISLIDGKPYKALKRHLSGHGLTPDGYRQRYGLKDSYPMVSETYSQARRDMAKKIGLGRKPGQKVVARKPAKAGARNAPAENSQES